MLQGKHVSLLWTSDEKVDLNDLELKLVEPMMTDLGVELLVQSLCENDPDSRPDTRKVIQHLTFDEETIHYRLDVMRDFLEMEEFGKEIRELIPLTKRIEQSRDNINAVGVEPIRKIAWSVERLEFFVEFIQKMSVIMEKYRAQFRSAGLKKLDKYIESVMQSPEFINLTQELPFLRDTLTSMSSVTIGINLDSTLKPVEAVFLSVEPKPFRQKSVLANLLGLSSANDKYHGISQFHSIKTGSFDAGMFRDLADILQRTLLPVATSLKKYSEINTTVSTDLAFEFRYYLNGAEFIRKMRKAGVNMCQPTVLPASQRECHIYNLYDLVLVFDAINQQKPVTVHPNDVHFDDNGRMLVITGPNKGGKTTYTRSIGLAQIMFQAGLFVAGSRAEISPVDCLFTHFNEMEKLVANRGRLGEEARRFSHMFDHLTRHSLLLLNEPLASTSPAEGSFLTTGIIRGIKTAGCRMVLTTHFLDIAQNIPKMNEEFSGDSKLISLVAGIEETVEDESGRTYRRRTYKIAPAPPYTESFAMDIARENGISEEQIMERLKERGVI